MKYIFFFIISYNLLSCKISEPTFKNIGQWQISKINATEVTVSTTAYFYNPNTVDGIKLTGINLAVQTDGKNLGKLEINESIMTIPRLSDFQIPISFVINFSDLIGNLSSIISIVSGKTVDLRCVGAVKVGYAIFGKSIKIDQTIPVNIKDIKKIYEN